MHNLSPAHNCEIGKVVEVETEVEVASNHKTARQDKLENTSPACYALLQHFNKWYPELKFGQDFEGIKEGGNGYGEETEDEASESR